jgi:hypothetical protein
MLVCESESERVRVGVRVGRYVCVYTCTCVCVCVDMNVRENVCMHGCLHIRMYVCAPFYGSFSSFIFFDLVSSPVSLFAILASWFPCPDVLPACTIS